MPTATETRPSESPTKDDLEGFVDPLKLPDKQNSESDDDVINFVQRKYKESAQSRRNLEEQWLLATAYENGEQWYPFKVGHGLNSLQDDNDPARAYVTANLIRPLKNKVKARLTMSKPDASVAPESDREIDIAAVPEAMDILDHYDRLFMLQQHTRLVVDCGLITTTCWDFYGWDPTKLAPVPASSPTGPPSMMSDIGDIVNCIVPCWEAYPDPRARCWEEVNWFVWAKRYPLEWFQDHYANGKSVKPDKGGLTQTYEYMQTRLDWVLGANARMPGDDNTALLLSFWQLPTPKYKQGRRIEIAGRTMLLRQNQLPYDWRIERNQLPFIPWQYETRYGTIWAPNFVDRQMPLQFYFNSTLSRVQDRINSDRLAMMIPKGSEVGTDAWESVRMLLKIYYSPPKGTEPGAPMPVYQQPPPINAEWFNYLTLLKGLMEDIGGVHEVSNGQVPAGVTAGNAIEILVQEDTTQMSEGIGNTEQYACTRGELIIGLATQFFKEERLLKLSSQADPAKAVRAVRAFEALRAGGRVTVTVEAGSATPKTAAAIDQQIQDWTKAGLFAPAMLPVVKMLCKLGMLTRADKMLQHIDEVIDAVKAMQPDPAQLAAQQGTIEQQKMLLDQQHQGNIQAAKTEHDVTVTRAKGDEARKTEVTKGLVKHHSGAILAEQEHGHDLESQQADHHHAAAMFHAQTVVPQATFSVPVKLGTTANISAQEQMGLEPDDPDDLEPIINPPPKLPALTKPGGNQS